MKTPGDGTHVGQSSNGLSTSTASPVHRLSYAFDFTPGLVENLEYRDFAETMGLSFERACPKPHNPSLRESFERIVGYPHCCGSAQGFVFSKRGLCTNDGRVSSLPEILDSDTCGRQLNFSRGNYALAQPWREAIQQPTKLIMS